MTPGDGNLQTSHHHHQLAPGNKEGNKQHFMKGKGAGEYPVVLPCQEFTHAHSVLGTSRLLSRMLPPPLPVLPAATYSFAAVERCHPPFACFWLHADA
jgi:hypothetical protein